MFLEILIVLSQNGVCDPFDLRNYTSPPYTKFLKFIRATKSGKPQIFYFVML